MQSLYFDDKLNMVPRRYSDIGISHRVRGQSERGVMRNEGVERASEFAPAVLALTERSSFFSHNALRYDQTSYPTGSMYICKKSVWLSCPQNENLHWIEFEDLEHAYRASDMGIPSRVNPYGVTQSGVASIANACRWNVYRERKGKSTSDACLDRGAAHQTQAGDQS
ncbi:hypothetical protein GPU89_20440 [Burkholderia cepacia]|nr:hypothetical protein [Burkholderia cepacia]